MPPKGSRKTKKVSESEQTLTFTQQKVQPWLHAFRNVSQKQDDHGLRFFYVCMLESMPKDVVHAEIWNGSEEPGWNDQTAMFLSAFFLLLRQIVWFELLQQKRKDMAPAFSAWQKDLFHLESWEDLEYCNNNVYNEPPHELVSLDSTQVWTSAAKLWAFLNSTWYLKVTGAETAGPKAVIKAIRVMQLHAFYLSLCYCYQPTEARVNSSFIHFFTLTLTQYLFVVDGHKPQYITHQEQKKLCDETPQLLKSFSCQVDLYESLPQEIGRAHV